MNEKTLEFGRWYWVTATAEKSHNIAFRQKHEHETVWNRIPRQPQRMLYVGYRDVSEGLMFHPQYFVPSRRIRLAVFIPDERTNRVYVPFEDVYTEKPKTPERLYIPARIKP